MEKREENSLCACASSLLSISSGSIESGFWVLVLEMCFNWVSSSAVKQFTMYMRVCAFSPQCLCKDTCAHRVVIVL